MGIGRCKLWNLHRETKLLLEYQVGVIHQTGIDGCPKSPTEELFHLLNTHTQYLLTESLAAS